MRVAVVGASGFVGRGITSALAAAAYDVVAISRHPPAIPDAEGHAIDVGDKAELRESLQGCEVAYYLVHSLSGDSFRARDRQLAEGFRDVAADAGVQRIIYLGGLGDEPGSEHLASRQEVGVILANGQVPVVELRAAVVLGAGSISFEMLRYLTERLPCMVCPRWVRTAIQPIALKDMIRYLMGALDVEPGIYDVGGAEVTSYRDMIAAYARVRGLRRRRIVDVRYLTPRLSSYWLDLVTPVDRSVSHALIESLATEVIVKDAARTDAAFGIRPMGLDASLSAALEDQARELDGNLFRQENGLRDGVYTVRMAESLPPGLSAKIDEDFERIGGSFGWYGLPLAWRVRAGIGRLTGEDWDLRTPPSLVQGEQVDWWLVARRQPGELVLANVRWFPGEAWLGYRSDEHRLVQVGSFRSRGIPGFLYWKLLYPVHHFVFRAMARHRVSRAAGITAHAHAGT
jgi:uncharacterized protein YbjT (DUF2867 family)